MSVGKLFRRPIAGAWRVREAASGENLRLVLVLGHSLVKTDKWRHYWVQSR